MDNSLRYSRFNHIAELKEGKEWVVLNLLSMSFRKLDVFEKDFFDHALDFPDSKLVKKLKRQGFLVDYDEIGKYKALKTMAAGSKMTYSLTVCPTLDCNFRCPYCFEDHRHGAMSADTQERLIALVKEQLDRYRPSKFSVCWFGGEPLLEPDIIDSLSERFMELSKERNIDYGAAIITNGYLLTPDTMKMLEKNAVSFIQITLDGLKEKNDRTRILASGEGSFDRITDNLKNIKTNARISIRLNSYQDNSGDIDELTDYFSELSKTTGMEYEVYSAYMESSFSTTRNMQEKELSPEEFYKSEAQRESSAIIRLKKPTFMGCGYESPYSFAVDAEGFLYKCWNLVGKTEHAVGNIFDKGDIIWTQFMAQEGILAMGDDITEDEECRECKLLPQCEGGCRYVRQSAGKVNICKKDYMIPKLDDLVKDYILSITDHKEKQIGQQDG